MNKRLKAIFFYALFWMVFFVTARLFFILTHFREASAFNPAMLSLTFWHGIMLDFSAIGYILIIPLLIIMPGVYFTGKWFRSFIKWYTYVFLVISAVIVVSDTLLYKYWGFRMDYTPLVYLKTPKAAMASVTTFQIAGVAMGIVLLSALFIFFYRRFSMFCKFRR